MSNGKGRERAFAERARRELDAWPEGPASGFEPLGDVVKRVINNPRCAARDQDEEATPMP